MDVVFIQSCDPWRYLPMLAVTGPNVADYCRRHGYRYEAFVGIKRGWWPWQASYNRLFQLRDLVESGFAGWAIHVDADAWINDPDFDLPAYLADKADRAAILAEAGTSGEPWDINNGIMLLNLGHPQGRRMVALWHAAFLAIPDEVLRGAEAWLGAGNDQDLLQQILRDDPTIAAAVLVERQAVLNSRHARFIRQHYRSHTADLDRRIANIAAEVAAVGAARADAAPPAVQDDRAWSAIRHPTSEEIPLVEAAAAVPDADAVRAAIEQWHGDDRPDAVPASLAALAQALAARDAAAVAAIMAEFGRTPAAEGHLGGARQHRRVTTDRAFAARRALRTHDALVSLAEACGALAIENPGIGLWGFNIRRAPGEVLARIGDTLGMDAAPPSAFGRYLGLDVGGGRVLHLRMVEALHAAWRIRQVQMLLGIESAVELGGAVGLRALCAWRLGSRRHAVIDGAALGAVQRYLLTAEGAGGVRLLRDGSGAVDGALLFDEEGLAEQPAEIAVARLRAAREDGARALLSVNHEAQTSRDGGRPAMRDLVARAGGFDLMQRTPHALRPGFVEELFVAR